MRRVKDSAAYRCHFNKHDQRRLGKWLKQVVEARSYRRIQAVLLVATGVMVSQVAQILGVSRQSIHGWIRRYRARRVPEDLQDAPRSGRPLAARAITKARIAREFRRDPLRLGYNTTGWTVVLLAAHLKQRYGCQITARTLRRRMKQMDLRWKRPRYVYSEKAPHIAQKKGRSYVNYGDFALGRSCCLRMKPSCASFRLCATAGPTKASRRWCLSPVKTPSASCSAPLISRRAIVSCSSGTSKGSKTFKPFSRCCARDTETSRWPFC
jgi:transposase